MRSVMAWAGAIAVAWHTVLGCCAHHSHDHGEMHAAEQLPTRGCAHGHGLHSHGSPAPTDLAADVTSPGRQALPWGDEPRGSTPGGDCNEQNCVFAAPGPLMAADWLDRDLPCWEGLPAVATGMLNVAVATNGHQQPEWLPQPWPSLRAHLALGVLLI